MHKIYDELDDEIGCCQICGSIIFDHSHNFARSQYPGLIAEKRNITLLCRTHHRMWEDNDFDGLDIGVIEIIKNMISLTMDETDELKQQQMLSYIAQKIIKARDKAPTCDWIQELYDSL